MRRGSGVGTDAKRAAREQRLARQRRASRIRLVLLIALLVGIVAGAVALYDSDVLAISEVEVTGVQELSAAEVREVLALPQGATLLRFPGEEMEERLLEHPWIRDADVSRRFPDTLVVHVEERQPAALIDTGDARFWVVDDEGFVLGQHTPDTTQTVLVVRELPAFEPVPGERWDSAVLDNALAITTGLGDELRSRVRAVSAQSVDLTTLITVDDIEILVGAAADLEKKEAVALRIMEEQADSVVHINVRTVDRPTWRGLDTGQ